jgi:hypothetical protein
MKVTNFDAAAPSNLGGGTLVTGSGAGSVLSPYGIAGGVLELPGVTGVPTIPYPGNQVG